MTEKLHLQPEAARLFGELVCQGAAARHADLDALSQRCREPAQRLQNIGLTLSGAQSRKNANPQRFRCGGYGFRQSFELDPIRHHHKLTGPILPLV